MLLQINDFLETLHKKRLCKRQQLPVGTRDSTFLIAVTECQIRSNLKPAWTGGQEAEAGGATEGGPACLKKALS